MNLLLQVKELGLALWGILKYSKRGKAEGKRRGQALAIARERLAGSWTALDAVGGQSGSTAHGKQPFWEMRKKWVPAVEETPDTRHHWLGRPVEYRNYIDSWECLHRKMRGAALRLH